MHASSRRLAHFLLAPLVMLAMSASASTFIVTEDELEPSIFPAVAESIRANLDGPNAPQGMTSAKQQQVLRSLDRIQGFLDDDPRRHHSRIRNEQARLNAVLAPQVARQDGQSDVICQRFKPVGSNIPTTRCRSRADMEDDTFRAVDEIQRLQQVESRGGG